MDQRGRTGTLLVVLLLVAMVPAVAPASAADAGAVADLQAQDIQAEYDPITESTTITWRNVNSTDGLLNQELQGSTYRIYRHTAPIDALVLSSLVPLGHATRAQRPTSSIVVASMIGDRLIPSRPIRVMPSPSRPRWVRMRRRTML